jgi:hypothetical protein
MHMLAHMSIESALVARGYGVEWVGTAIKMEQS